MCWNRYYLVVLSYQPRLLEEEDKFDFDGLKATSGGPDNGEPFLCNIWEHLLFSRAVARLCFRTHALTEHVFLCG